MHQVHRDLNSGRRNWAWNFHARFFFIAMDAENALDEMGEVIGNFFLNLDYTF